MATNILTIRNIIVVELSINFSCNLSDKGKEERLPFLESGRKKETNSTEERKVFRSTKLKNKEENSHEQCKKHLKANNGQCL